MSKNSLVAFYEKGIKEADAEGFADTFKQATELLFKKINAELEMDLHFEDVIYLDGYFVFAKGTNSVVHFHVKEAPGWLGGIWWEPIPTEETKNKTKKVFETEKLSCNLFFQFEAEIDKFKPSASTYAENFWFYLDPDSFSSDYSFNKACDDLKFIVTEPELAFYREMHYVDYNHTYVSKATAKRYVEQYKKRKEKEAQITAINDQAMFGAIKTIIGELVAKNDAFIYDSGEGWSPRYEIVLRNTNAFLYSIETDAWYSLELLGKKALKLYDKTYKECAKRTGYKTYFDNKFSSSCFVAESKKYNKLYKTYNKIYYCDKDNKNVIENKFWE